MSPTDIKRRPFFLRGTAGRLFCQLFAPRGRESGERLLLILPPFAEEMNKCRRMMTLAAEAYCETGQSAMVVDLYGTGDSEGDFRDASVSQWCADISSATSWLVDQGFREIDVLGIRAGALVFPLEALVGELRPRHLALWQPTLKGKQAIGQFLRLLAAENIVGKTDGAAVDPRKILADNGYVEVAGYDLSRRLVEEFEALSLPDLLTGGWSAIRWFDVVSESQTGVSPAAARTVSAAAEKGINIDGIAVHGEPFWGTPEIAVVADLIKATSDFLLSGK